MLLSTRVVNKAKDESPIKTVSSLQEYEKGLNLFGSLHVGSDDDDDDDHD